MILAAAAVIASARWRAHEAWRPRRPAPGATRVSIANVSVALELYRLDCGAYPSEDVGLKALIEDPGAPGWKGPYLRLVPADAWGRSLRYSLASGKAEIRSAGPDLAFDTPDDIMD